VTELVQIHIRQAPVKLWMKSQEHSDELQREFVLIATQAARGESGHDVPHRLTALIDEVTAQYGGFSAENERRFAEAAAAGEEWIDLDYELPRDVSAAVKHLGELLDEADEYCRRGQHLLTLATPPDQVRFRRWFLDEFTRQISGEPPLPWPDYTGD